LGIFLKNNLTQIFLKGAKQVARASNPVAEQFVNNPKINGFNLGSVRQNVKIPKKKPKRRSNSFGISLKNKLTQTFFIGQKGGQNQKQSCKAVSL
jgi:hypothetical protein